MITAPDLLETPRGRRFCFELMIAAQGDDEWSDGDLHTLLLWAEYHLGHARGDGATLFGPGADRPEPAPADASVAAAIDAVPLGEITVDAVVDALEATADSAMAWQPRDDRDALLDRPAVRATLGRLADRAAGSALVQQLVRPLDTRWTVSFPREDDADGPARERPTPEAALTSWRADLVAEQRRGASRGVSGTWWTTPPWPLEATTGAPFPERGPLELWAAEDSWGDERAIVRRSFGRPGDRVARVDSPEDWAALCRRWPLAVDRTTRRTDWAASTGVRAGWVQPDWAAVAEEFDVVHLTVAGWFRCSGIAIAVDDDRASVVAGWTPDAAYRLTDAAPDVSAPTLWTRPEDDGHWTTVGA